MLPFEVVEMSWLQGSRSKGVEGVAAALGHDALHLLLVEVVVVLLPEEEGEGWNLHASRPHYPI